MRKRYILSTLVGMMLAGCVGSSGATLSPEQQVGTIVAQTQMAQTVEAALVAPLEDTPIPSGGGDVEPPELIAAHTATAEGIQILSTTRVLFEPGGTQAWFEGSVGNWQANDYVVSAMAGQILQVTLSPPGAQVYFKIFKEDGTDMTLYLENRSAYWTQLSDTQDYTIRVISENGAQSYSINISVPATVEFAAEETSISINGHVGENGTVEYMLYARGGQTLHLTVTTPGVQVALSVTGMNDGQPYLRYVSDTTNWTFILPLTQFYKISVVTIGPATDFTLVVEVN